jgi:tight adherence protein B
MAARMVAVVATVAVVVPGAPAGADTGPALSITGTQASVGAVEFFLAARNLPAGVTLAAAGITVEAGGVALPSTVRDVSAGTEAPQRGVVLVVDASGSMAGARLTAARAAAADYAAAAPDGVWLGLVTVSDRPTVAVPPTPSRTAFAAAAGRIQASGETALYDGIAAAAELLDPEERPEAAAFVERRVIVLSDGADTSSTVEPTKLARQVARADLTLDAVAFGEADRAQLATLTEAGGGSLLPAADSAALRTVLRNMAADLSSPVLVTARVPAELSGKSSDLRVRVTLAGGASTSAATPVTFRFDPAAAAGPTEFQVRDPGGTRLYVALGALALALFLFALLFLLPIVGRTPVQRRLGQLDRFAIGRRSALTAGRGDSGSPVLRAMLAVAERGVHKPDRRERIELALDRAGSSLRAAEWQLIRIGVSAGAAVLLALLLPWWLGLVVGLAGGWLGSAQVLRFRAGRRTRKFAEQLPDALQLVVGSLRSGFSLLQSIDALVREGADPVAGELGRALAETRLGGDLEDALERVGERNGSQDIAWLVMAIRIQREVGGNLSEVLETAVTTMRERSRLGRHVRALSAEGRLSAMVLLGMPIVLGGWMFVFRREYLRPLYTEPMGLMMLGGSVVMVGIGALWLRKLVKVVV